MVSSLNRDVRDCCKNSSVERYSSTASESVLIVPEALNALFRNCIFWGENGIVDSEIDILRSGTSTPYSVVFDYNAWKVNGTPANITTSTGIVNNQVPAFDSIDTYNNFYNFRLKTSSMLIDKGTLIGSPPTDLDGKLRPLGIAPDLGAFEKR